jgi:hypothetical protein
MLEESVKEKLQRSERWPVYKRYEIIPEDEGLFVVAPPVSQGDSMTDDDVLSFYPPLQARELLVELAEFADKPITPEDVRRWAEVYGLLCSSPEEDVVSFKGISFTGLRRRERVARFVEAATEVRVCLRALEAVRREGPVNLEELSTSLGPLPPIFREVLESWKRHKTVERPWLYGVIGRTVQKRIREHCYPKLTIFTRDGKPSGRFGLDYYGFYNLLGAVWLHMAWLLDENVGENATYCRLPDCGRLITIEPGQPASDAEFKGAGDKWKSNVRGTYKTRIDIEFCKKRPCRQKYSYRKTHGWSGYQ